MRIGSGDTQMNAMTPIEARTQFEADREGLAAYGIHLDHVQGYATAEIRRDYTIAMDALPALQTAALITAWPRRRRAGDERSAAWPTRPSTSWSSAAA